MPDVDLRDTDYLGPVGDQGDANSCYGFTACRAVEYLYKKETNKDIRLSVQDIYQSNVHSQEEEEEGISLVETFEWMEESGCLSEDSCPYRQKWNVPPLKDRHLHIEFYVRWKNIGRKEMRNYLKTTGPICVSVEWIDNEMGFLEGNEIYNGPADLSSFIHTKENPVGIHTLLVVGYGTEKLDDKKIKYWIVQNSHGTGWGNNGFLRFNKKIKGLDGPLINGGIVPTKIIYPEPQVAKKKKREKVHSQSKKKHTKSSETEHKKLEKTNKRSAKSKRKNYKSMEMAKSNWAVIKKSPPMDSWGMGCLIYELFSGLKLSKTEELRNTASIPKSLLPDYQRLLRLNTSKLIENSEYFQNKLVDTIHFMEIVSLKDSVEKDTFFRKLPNLADQLPREIVLKKLLPLLASALEFGSTAAPALTALLKIGSWLSVEEFRVKILPTLTKLFASNDRAVRVSLLQHIDQYGESLSAQAVDEQVYPHVATGVSDTSAFLRELTLKSMLVLALKTNIAETTGGAGMDNSIPGNASLLGWAMSSLTLKGKPSDHAPVASVSSSALTPTSSNASSVVGTPSTAPMRVSSTPDFTEHHAPTSPTSTDGWGELENGIDEEPENDKDGWDDLEPLEETKPTPVLTNIQAAQRRPVSQPVSHAKAPILQPKSTPKLSMDEDDDLWGALATPAPKTSKPLNLKLTATDDDDPWAAIAAPAPTTRAKPLSAGRGRGAKPAAPKLGAQRISLTSSRT